MMLGLFFRSKSSPKPTVRLQCDALESRDVPAARMATAYFAPPSTPVVQAAPIAPITLSSAQYIRANRVISTFENSTPVFQYGYIENLGDGRGFTAGRVGFTTGTGDLVLVVERYTQLKPNNGLAKYLPRLRELAATGSDSTVGLEGMDTLWKRGATTQLFCAVQNEIARKLYYDPALQIARNLGVRSALTLVALYDTNIQHGGGEDPDGLPAIIARTNAALGGTPKSGINEKVWLARFLDERERTLSNAFNEATRDVWRESVDRVRVFRTFLQAGNMNFNGPLRYTVFGDTFTIA